MRSFLLASAAACLTVAFVGCDAPVEPAKPATPATPPAASGDMAPGKPAEEGKMTPTPAPVPEKPAEKPADAPK